ncbi:hypothetical protein YPPY45_4186, partial [Yersinia pestis PY-45]
MRRPARQRKK